MSTTTPFEKPTDELRQVRRHVSVKVEASMFWEWEELDVVIAVQRKWLVQDGELYDAVRPRTPSDIVVRPSESYHKDGFRYGSIGYWYCPSRVEWRDLPVADTSTNATT